MAEISVQQTDSERQRRGGRGEPGAFGRKHGILAVNIMASPGAGKTSVILATAERLPAGRAPGRDRRRPGLAHRHRHGAGRGHPGGADQHGRQLPPGRADDPLARCRSLPLDEIDVLFIENVGNLVCPAEFDLGAALAVVVASVPEGPRQAVQVPGHVRRGAMRCC